MKTCKNVVIFASGNGSNAEAIARYFIDRDDVKICAVYSNREKAKVHDRMKPFNIPTYTFSKEDWANGHPIVEKLQSHNTDLIVLAGFMTIVTEPITTAFKSKIINIHPSLLPKFGGVGMWGMNVHRAVVEAKSTESGITIHYVNEEIDEGEIILQASCKVEATDTPQIVAEKVHELEYKYFPIAIEKVLFQ